MPDPLISVLIPAYNRRATIGQAIHSALGGGIEDIEIIVSDNGSSDGTADIVAGIARCEPRIRLLRQLVNKGPLPNWKVCLDQARGRWIHWLWSDDWIQPSFYRILVEGMARSRAEVALSAATLVCPEDGWSHIRYSLRPVPSPTTAEDLLRRGLMGFELPVSPAAALLPLHSVRRHFTDAIPRTGNLDCNRRAIGCDAIMILGAIHDAGNAHCCPEPLVNFRNAADSISVQTDDALRNAHYGWARAWWARRHRLPRSWSVIDYLRIAHGSGFPRLAMGCIRGLV